MLPSSPTVLGVLLKVNFSGVLDNIELYQKQEDL